MIALFSIPNMSICIKNDNFHRISGLLKYLPRYYFWLFIMLNHSKSYVVNVSFPRCFGFKSAFNSNWLYSYTIISVISFVGTFEFVDSPIGFMIVGTSYHTKLRMYSNNMGPRKSFQSVENCNQLNIIQIREVLYFKIPSRRLTLFSIH